MSVADAKWDRIRITVKADASIINRLKRRRESMEEKWIPTAERLPNQMEFIESYVRSKYAAEFLVTIDGAEKATTLYYSQTGVWHEDNGAPYNVVAWMKLPKIYREKA